MINRAAFATAVEEYLYCELTTCHINSESLMNRYDELSEDGSDRSVKMIGSIYSMMTGTIKRSKRELEAA